MADIDTVLAMVENPTRRRILQVLSREPHYPLQLSKELNISQQSVMRHLRVMEENGMVSSYMESSDRGGPDRRQYVPRTRFTLYIDMRQGMFDMGLLDQGDTWQEPEVFDRVEGTRLEDIRREMAEMDARLEELTRMREGIIETKERLFREAMCIAESERMDYQLRMLMYEMLDRPREEIEGIGRAMEMRKEAIRDMISNMGRVPEEGHDDS